MVFGLFSKERALQKTIEKATNKLSQQPDRWGALEKLREEGSRRSAVRSLQALGRHAAEGRRGRAGEELGRRRARREGQLYPRRRWRTEQSMRLHEAARATRRSSASDAVSLSSRSRARESPTTTRSSRSSTSMFKSEPPGYARFPDRRIDLIKWFTEWKGATEDEVIPRVTPYLKDFDENVRFTAIDGLSLARSREDRGPADRRARAPRRGIGPHPPHDRRGARAHEGAARRARSRKSRDADGPAREDFKVDAGWSRSANAAPSTMQRLGPSCRAGTLRRELDRNVRELVVRQAGLRLWLRAFDERERALVVLCRGRRVLIRGLDPDRVGGRLESPRSGEHRGDSRSA